MAILFINLRLLKSLENLQVPMEKQSSLKNAHSFLAKEKTKSAALEDGLAELQVRKSFEFSVSLYLT